MGASVGYVSAPRWDPIRASRKAPTRARLTQIVIDDLIAKGRAKDSDRDAVCRASARLPIITL